MLRHRMYGQILAMSTPSSTEQHHSSSSMLRPRIYMVLLCFAAHSAVLRVRVQLQAGRELRHAARPAALSAQHKGDSWPTSKSWTSKLVQLVDTLVIHHKSTTAMAPATGCPPALYLLPMLRDPSALNRCCGAAPHMTARPSRSVRRNAGPGALRLLLAFGLCPLALLSPSPRPDLSLSPSARPALPLPTRLRLSCTTRQAKQRRVALCTRAGLCADPGEARHLAVAGAGPATAPTAPTARPTVHLW